MNFERAQLDNILEDLLKHKRPKSELTIMYIQERLSNAYKQYSKVLTEKYSQLSTKDYRTLRKIWR